MTDGLMIHEFSDDLAPHFREINEQWITAMYRVEPADREVLDDPRGRIVDCGGAILFVEAVGLGIVGTAALRAAGQGAAGQGAFELTKMGVLESARGRGVGAFLLVAMIARARAMGADPLYLLSNTQSAAAIHLYERMGFAHDAGIMRAYGARYDRCDVAMLHCGFDGRM